MSTHFDQIIEVTSNQYINGSEFLYGEKGLKQCMMCFGIMDLDLFDINNLNKFIISLDLEKSKISRHENTVAGIVFKKSVIDALSIKIEIQEEIPGTKIGSYTISNLYDVLRIPLIGEIKNFNKPEEEEIEKSLDFVYKLSMLVDSSLYHYYYKINKIINECLRVLFKNKIVKNQDNKDFYVIDEIDFESVPKERRNECNSSGSQLISLNLNDFTINEAKYQEKHWLFYKKESKEKANPDQMEVAKTISEPNDIYVPFQLKLTDIAKKWDIKEKKFVWIDKDKQTSNYIFKNSINFCDKDMNIIIKQNLSKNDLNELFKNGSKYLTYITPSFSISTKFGITCRVYDVSSGYNRNMRKMINHNQLFESTDNSVSTELSLAKIAMAFIKEEEEKEQE